MNLIFYTYLYIIIIIIFFPTAQLYQELPENSGKGLSYRRRTHNDGNKNIFFGQSSILGAMEYR